MQAQAFTPAPSAFPCDPSTVLLLPVDNDGLAARVAVEDYIGPSCDLYTHEELERFAHFLAGEMEYRVFLASGRSLLWYREQVSPAEWTTALCDLEGAFFLRKKTIEVCRDVTYGSGLRAVPDARLGRLHEESRVQMGVAELPERRTFGVRTILLGVLGLLALACIVGTR